MTRGQKRDSHSCSLLTRTEGLTRVNVGEETLLVYRDYSNLIRAFLRIDEDEGAAEFCTDEALSKEAVSTWFSVLACQPGLKSIKLSGNLPSQSMLALVEFLNSSASLDSLECSYGYIPAPILESMAHRLTGTSKVTNVKLVLSEFTPEQVGALFKVVKGLPLLSELSVVCRRAGNICWVPNVVRLDCFSVGVFELPYELFDSAEWSTILDLASAREAQVTELRIMRTISMCSEGDPTPMDTFDVFRQSLPEESRLESVDFGEGPWEIEWSTKTGARVCLVFHFSWQ